MNLYAYVGNNAINYSDPLGLYSWREFGSDVGNAWNSLSNDPRVNWGVKIVGGLLETTFWTFMIVDWWAICMSVWWCLVWWVLVVQWSINFWWWIWTTADWITQLITWEFEDRGSQYLNAVDNWLNYFWANCTTKAVVKGVGVAIDTAYTVKGIVKSAGKRWKNVVDIELKYKEDWTEEQRLCADEKCAFLTKADTRVNHNVERSWIDGSSLYKKSWGTVPEWSDVDHKVDLQLWWKNILDNLAPLDSSVNRSLWAQIRAKIKNLPHWTKIWKITIRD